MTQTTTFHRRHATLLLLGAALCAASLGALAQEKFPSKPITLVVPQAAGGANDAIARVLAQRLSEQMGQSVVVDNRPGAGGQLAGQQLKAARASSVVNSCAWPLWCAARPPRLAISRWRCGSMAAKPRRPRLAAGAPAEGVLGVGVMCRPSWVGVAKLDSKS